MEYIRARRICPPAKFSRQIKRQNNQHIAMKPNPEQPLIITESTSTPGITRRHFVKRSSEVTAAVAVGFLLIRSEAIAVLEYYKGEVLLWRKVTVEQADVGKICGVDGDKIPVFATNVTVTGSEKRYAAPPITEKNPPEITGMDPIYQNNQLVGYRITATTITIVVATKP